MNTAHSIASPDDTQFKLFGDMPLATAKPQLKTAINSNRRFMPLYAALCRFITGDSHAIFLGTTRLQDYLQQSGLPHSVARLLHEQDWQPFEQRYAATGRAPYAPRLMMGSDWGINR
jgi:hypothetical protein